MTVIEHGKKQGTNLTSNFIPMGMFGLLVDPPHQRGYLQSSGFGPCIGLAMHNPDKKAAVLAHFMSKNAVKESIEAIGSQLETFQMSIKDANWSGAVFLGGQAKMAPKVIAKTTTVSAMLDIPRKSKQMELPSEIKKYHSTSNGPMDVAIGTGSQNNAAERALEIKQYFTTIGVTVTYIETGYESCDLGLESGILQLFDTPIFGTNNESVLKAGEKKPLQFSTAQML